MFCQYLSDKTVIEQKESFGMLFNNLTNMQFCESGMIFSIRIQLWLFKSSGSRTMLRIRIRPYVIIRIQPYVIIRIRH